MCEFVFIVFGKYIENGEMCEDILLVTKSEEKKHQYLQEMLDKPDSGYTQFTWGTFDIE